MARMTKASRAMVWGAGGVAAVMLALTGYAALTGDEEGAPRGKGGKDSSASPSPAGPTPSYAAPEDWTEPTRWAALPRGQRTDRNGNEVQFPRTTQGAVAMLAASSATESTRKTTVAEQNLGVYDSYLAAAERSAQNRAAVKEQAKQADREVREELGLMPDGPWPAGAYSRSHVIGFKVVQASGDKVSAYLLSRVSLKAEETDDERSSYTRTLMGATWEGGDWKLSGAVTTEAAQATRGEPEPKMAAPGDAAFNRAGWTAIREAS